MLKTKQKFAIIDSNALIHRAFHALPPLMTKEGVLTNAVYGFTSILLKTIKDLKPDYIVATFDLAAKTFRHIEYEPYKAHRVKQPDELYAQIPLVKEVLKAFNIPIFEKEGFEADDLIGTIAHLKSVDRSDIETIIVTGDQDTLQLVDDNTKVLSPHKGISETIIYDEKLVKEKFEGLTPNQLIDYKALRGDPSDNIPGVKGIGQKGAIDLLNEFGALENIYRNIESPKIKNRARELLKRYKTESFLSKKLATIIIDVPIDFNLEKCAFIGFNRAKVIEIFQKLNFKKLLGQLSTLENKLIAKGNQAGRRQGSLFEGGPKPEQTLSEKNPHHQYNLIDSEKELKKFLAQLKQQEKFCFDTETSNLDPFVSDLVGISFSWEKNIAYYLPIKTIKQIKNELKKIFADEKVQKIGHNLKFDVEVLEQYFPSPCIKGRVRERSKVNGVYFDTMVASYLLNPSSHQHSLDTLAFIELGYQMQLIEELIGKGKNQISLADVPVEKVACYSCEDALITWLLYKKFAKELERQGMFGLFEKIDMPLVEVLAQVEKNGVKVDDKFLQKISKKFDTKIKALEEETYRIAGEKFNLASPLQLKKILFEKMKIDPTGLGKTKTGISTGAAELQKLAGWLRENKEDGKKRKIIDLLLEFRELSKLKNTYLDALPELINPKDGRVHTSYNQTVTATGRLSSSDPNLQNIPIRTELGRQIRKAFVAEAGFKILKADYSQIELRIVASLANDKKMLKAFENKIDIHTQTAAAINDVEIKDVSPEMRRAAKEVNFGVLYGMGAWGLAQRTGISGQKAQEFITKYFKTFKGVRKYIDETIEMAREKGFVETFYGRRRYIPEINSGVQQIRSAAERMATNTPVQGSAADLIKLAMIEIHRELPKISPETKMILQVHDELVFEVPEKKVKKVAEFVQEKMCSVYKLRAPIEAEVSVGDNWGETEKIKL
ncbi:MAG: DNA polymerase I [Patescibacteria group bacterium]